jgi:hypothetical protein
VKSGITVVVESATKENLAAAMEILNFLSFPFLFSANGNT